MEDVRDAQAAGGFRLMSVERLESNFSRFLLEIGAVKFGSFRLKSGRISPYFVNLGVVGEGSSIWRLGEFYAKALVEFGLVNEIDVLFGPSYKGIPIVVSTSIALHKLFNISKRFAFNRKEAKDHGEGGFIIGKVDEGDKIGILDDVMTTGKTKEEVLSVLSSIGNVKIKFVLIALDRLERGETEYIATVEFCKRYGIPVKSIVTVQDVAKKALEGGSITVKEMEEITNYLKTYGGKTL
ncbi:MAG: orotate phosphoribosyltransferase [Candidatus Methanomethyliaceae archaeon]|nr:orotate phosphoribosyltransferase [Candidatus Methanomethyliaceae archaeon]